MNFRKLAVVAALSVSLSSAPVVAQTANGGSATIERAGAVLDDANQIKGSTAIVAILALAAIIGGAVILPKHNSRPTSP